MKVWNARNVRRNLLGIAESSAADVPTLESWIEPMRDAMDPENEIEDQYNPKHNKVRAVVQFRLRRNAVLRPLRCGRDRSHSQVLRPA